MKRTALTLAGLLLLLPAAGLAHTFSLRLGTYLPSAPANLSADPDSLWAIEFDQMSFKRSDYRGSILGGSFEFFISKQFSLQFTVDAYSKDRYGYYKDYVGYSFDEGDFAFPSDLYRGDFQVVHTFNVSVTPVQLSAKFTPLGRKGRVIPFVGGGVGYYRWSVTMRGETIDFSDDTWVYDDPQIGEVQIWPIVQTYGHESGWAFGYHAFGGFQVPIGMRVTLEGEARYHWAKARFEEWFLGFSDFQVGGLALTLGINFWF